MRTRCEWVWWHRRRTLWLQLILHEPENKSDEDEISVELKSPRIETKLSLESETCKLTDPFTDKRTPWWEIEVGDFITIFPSTGSWVTRKTRDIKFIFIVKIPNHKKEIRDIRKSDRYDLIAIVWHSPSSPLNHHPTELPQQQEFVLWVIQRRDRWDGKEF